MKNIDNFIKIKKQITPSDNLDLKLWNQIETLCEKREKLGFYSFGVKYWATVAATIIIALLIGNSIGHSVYISHVQENELNLDNPNIIPEIENYFFNN